MFYKNIHKCWKITINIRESLNTNTKYSHRVFQYKPLDVKSLKIMKNMDKHVFENSLYSP